MESLDPKNAPFCGFRSFCVVENLRNHLSFRISITSMQISELFLQGVTREQARSTLLEDVNYFGTCMVALGDADGMVSGAIHTTANTVRPALQIIKVC